MPNALRYTQPRNALLDTLRPVAVSSRRIGDFPNDGRDYGKYGLREDGTKKGEGWLGILPGPDGGIMSEVSIGIDFGKGQVSIPTIVPTTTTEDIKRLREAMRLNQRLPDDIVRKAVEHAKLRMAKGLSPFVD